MLDHAKLLTVPHLGSTHQTKDQLREVMALLTRNFVNAGGKIKVCRPAVAYGSEISNNVKEMLLSRHYQ